MSTAPARPLSGVRVVDVTSQLSGPYCTWLLAALGADVIKVERPDGDPARATGPFVASESLYFSSVNRGKRSVVLDLKSDEGAAHLAALIRTSDVLIENLRPGALARLGFSTERIAELNPRLVFASISGFGQDGPLSQRPAFDVVVQAMSGLMSITGPEGGDPVRVGVSIGDIAGGLFAALEIVANLFARDRQDGPARVDISMLDCQLALMENAIARCLNTEEVPVPLGTRHPSVAPFQAFPTSDGIIVIAVDSDATWARMCRAIGRADLVADERFAGSMQRLLNHGALEAALASHLRTRPSTAWLEALTTADVPCGPLSSLPEALASGQVEARRMLVDVEGRDGQPLRFVAAPFGRRDPSRAVAPRLGEHTAEVLNELSTAKGDQV
jgi:CoA:oxalate CoA-transferase